MFALLNALIQLIDSRTDREEGQGLAEYALILALIAIVAIAALNILGPAIATQLTNVGNEINNASSGN